MDMELDAEINGGQQEDAAEDAEAQAAAQAAQQAAQLAAQQAAQAQAFLQALAGQITMQQPQQQPLRPQPNQVKLPDLWENEPQLWFERAEAQFRRCGVTDSRQQADILLSALPEPILKSVRDILLDRSAPDTTIYHRLKERLLKRFAPSKWQQAYQVIHHPGIGDLRPSQLLDSMLSLLPVGEQPTILFQALYLERLPSEIRDQLAAADFESVREMAVLADTIWDSRSERFQSGVSAVRSTSPGRKKNRKKSPGRRKRDFTPAPGGACFYHHTFGEGALKCEPPCSWQGNGQAAGSN